MALDVYQRKAQTIKLTIVTANRTNNFAVVASLIGCTHAANAFSKRNARSHFTNWYGQLHSCMRLLPL